MATMTLTFLQQLVAQRTAFVEVKQELTDDIATSHHHQHADMMKDNDEHLCVVCMDNERSCLYVPCNHLVVCVECGVRRGHQGGVSALPVLQRADRPGGERGGAGGGVMRRERERERERERVSHIEENLGPLWLLDWPI